MKNVTNLRLKEKQKRRRSSIAILARVLIALDDQNAFPQKLTGGEAASGRGSGGGARSCASTRAAQGGAEGAEHSWKGEGAKGEEKETKRERESTSDFAFSSLFFFPTERRGSSPVNSLLSTLPRPQSTMTAPRPLSMPSSFRGIATCRSSACAKFQPQCGIARPSSTTAKTTTPLSQDRRCRRRHRRPSTSSSSTSSTSARRPLLPPLRAIGFDLLGGRGDNNGDRNSSSSPLVPGGSPSSSSSAATPRDLLLAAGRLILLRDLMTEAPGDSPSAAALSLLRAVASPGGRNDGAASSAGAELAAALAARPSFSFSSSSSSSSPSSPSIGGWRGFLLDEVVVGRNNPLARSVARGGVGGSGEGDGDGGETSAAAAAGAALAADLSALQSLAFDGATAAAWVRGADSAVPLAWLDALAAAVDGGNKEKEEEKEEKEKEKAEEIIVPLPRLLPPLSRAQRSRAALSLSSHRSWADGAPDLISLWSRHGSGNVGSYFAFEWNPSSSPNLITPSAEDRGGGVVFGNEKVDGAAAAAWEHVASRLAAWARGDRMSPFDGGAFAARLELPPSSFRERGSGGGGGDGSGGGDGGGDESDDDDKDKEKKKDKKKKKSEGEATSSSSTSPLPSLSLWDGLRTSPVLLASGARLVRLPAVGNGSGGNSLPLRSLWRALRLHPRARWVVVSDSFPSGSSGGGGGEAAMAMEGELPPGVALAVRKR